MSNIAINQTTLAQIAAQVTAQVLAELAAKPEPAPAPKPAPEITPTVVAQPDAGPDAITFGALTVERPDAEGVDLDTIASAKQRSPLNKLRYRTEKAQPLGTDVTVRDLLAEYERLAAVVAARDEAKAEAKPAKSQAKAEGKAAAPAKARKRDGKGRFLPADAEAPADDRVQTLVDTLGVSREAAESLIAAVK